MVFVQMRKVKGKKYIYLDKSIRIGKEIKKISKFLGEKDKLSKKDIEKAKKAFLLEIDNKIIDLKLSILKKKYKKLEYSLTWDEIKKLEEMNLKYNIIKNNIKKEDLEDLNKRFIANFVFESNALEGNSLTLKNFSEVIFENRTLKGGDLREIYDAKNSYKSFAKLLNSRKHISERLIIDLHKNLMKNIDSRIDYKQLPNEILGRRLKISEPNKVNEDMKELIEWYHKNKEKIYPLELAFKFHRRFEEIHPFSDGNGRVGRMLLNYILLKNGFFPIIIRKTQRNKYLNALKAADMNKWIPLMRFALKRTKDTYRKFFEIYYEYAK